MRLCKMKNVVARSRKLSLLTMLVVLLFSSALFAAEPAPVSVKLPLPAVIQDSLPWFAVFELQNENAPFTRNHLNILAQKSERVALVYLQPGAFLAASA